MAEQATLTDQEVAAFIEKLESWAEQLSEREQAFLRLLLDDAVDAASSDPSGFPNLEAAATSGDDVVGFGSFDAAGSGLGGAVFAYSNAVSAVEGELVALQD